MHDVSGVSGAGPIWHELMSRLHQSTPSHQPPEPAALRHSQVKFQDDLEPARHDYFVGDTVVTRVQLVQDGAQSPQGAPKIVAPVSRTILALDPDIPSDNQRMWLRAGSVNAEQASKLSWRVGTRTVGHGAELAWEPWPGEHRIELLDGNKHVLDTVYLEVRAYAPRQ